MIHQHLQTPRSFFTAGILSQTSKSSAGRPTPLFLAPPMTQL